MTNVASPLVPARFGPRHGLSWQRAVEGAVANVRHLPERQIAFAATSIVRDGLPSNRRARRYAAKAQGKKIGYSTSITVKPPKPPMEGCDAHLAYIEELIAPSGSEEVLTEAAEFWFAGKINQHAKDLEGLRTSAPAIYVALLDGKLATAAKLGLRVVDETVLRRVLDSQARLLIVATAHSRVQSIRGIATEPYGRRFSGFTGWKTAGHVLLSTVAGPASVVQKFCTLAATDKAPADPDKLHAFLLNERLLPPTSDGERIIKVARSIADELVEDIAVGRVAARAEEIFHFVAPAAALDSAGLAESGLSRAGFVEWRTGFSASEASTLVAIDLLRSLAAVPEMVSAVLADTAPAVARSAPSGRQIAYATVLLRADGKPDKEAYGLARNRGCGGGLSPANRSARQPIEAVHEKTSRAPDMVTRFEQRFAIHAVRFFQC